MERDRLLKYIEHESDEMLDNIALSSDDKNILFMGTKKEKVSQMVKIIACRWKDLEKNEKNKYERLAAKDVDRHLKEMKGYKRNLNKWAKTHSKTKDSITNESEVKSHLKLNQSESNTRKDPFHTHTKKRGRPKKLQTQQHLSSNNALVKKSNSNNRRRYYWNTLGRLHISSPKIFTWTKHTQNDETRQKNTAISSDAELKVQNMMKNSDTGKEKKNFLFYDFDLGRAYFSSFYFRGERFSVGDFVCVGPNQIYRMIGAYQAMKSYIGAWNKKEIPTDEIQKRGHPYAIMVPLVPGINPIEKVAKDPTHPESDSIKNNELSNDNIKVTSTQYTPLNHEIYLDGRISSDIDENNLYLLPLWLGDPLFAMKKIDVEVVKISSKDSKHNLERKYSNSNQYDVMHCIKETRENFKKQFTNKTIKIKTRDVLNDLTDAQVDILSSSVKTLTKKFLPKSWNPRFCHKHVQFVSKKTKQLRSSQTEIPFEINYSSDENEMDVKMRQPMTFVNIAFEDLPLPSAPSNVNKTQISIGSEILSLESVRISFEYSSKMNYLNLITTSIGHLSEQNGSSLETIYKSMQSMFNIPVSFNTISNITNAIQLGLKEGRFIQVKRLYKMNPEYKVDNLIRKTQIEEIEIKDRNLTNRKRIKLTQEQIDEKVRAEKIEKRKFPMDDLELIKEDKILRVRPPHPKNPPSLPLLLPNNAKTNYSNSRQGLGSDILQIFHFFRGSIGWQKKKTPSFSVNHLLSCCEEICNGNAKHNGMLPPLVVHLFVVALRYLINKMDINSYLKALGPIVSPSNWSEILRLYLDCMQTCSISPSPAHVLRDFTKDNPNELPSHYYGYLGPPSECLAKAHAKLCKAESWMLTTKDCMCLLRLLCDDILGNCPQVEEQINEKMEKMNDLSKKKRGTKLHWRNIKLAYHRHQKTIEKESNDVNENVKNEKNPNTSIESGDAEVNEQNGANNEQEKTQPNEKSQMIQSKVKPTASNNVKNSQLKPTKEEYEMAEQEKNKAAGDYDQALRNLIVRLEPIGYDRNHSAVYYCSHDPEHVYLETLPHVPKEDGDAKKTQKNGWKRISNNLLFDEYVNSLDVRGIRERELKHQLLHKGYIRNNLHDDQKMMQIRKRKKEMLLNKLEIAKKACTDSNRRSGRLSQGHQQELQKIEEELIVFNTSKPANDESQDRDVKVKTGFELLKEFENKKAKESNEQQFWSCNFWYRNYHNGAIGLMVQDMINLETQYSELSTSKINGIKNLKSMKKEWNKKNSSRLSAKDKNRVNDLSSGNILNELKNALLDLEEKVIKLSGKYIEYKDRKKWAVDMKADKKYKQNLPWKKKIYTLQSHPNQGSANIRNILISAIESARRAHLIEIGNELRSSLKLIRPDSGKNAKEAALATLERYGGYKSTDVEDANIDIDDAVAITKKYQKWDNSPINLIKEEARILLYCLEDKSFDRDEWRKTVEVCKTLSRFSTLLCGFAYKAYFLIEDIKTRRDALTESIKDWKTKKPQKKTKNSKLNKNLKSQSKYWVDAEPLQKYVLAKVCNKYPWWPSRVYEVKDSSIKKELESLNRIVISLVGKEGHYVLTKGEQVKNYTPDISTEDVSNFDEDIVLDWMESVKETSWLVSRLPSTTT